MKGLPRRTLANLVAIALVSAVLIVYAFAQLLTGALLSDAYPLVVRVPRTGGLIPQQEVTLSGVSVGLVERFELTADAVDIHLTIDEGRKIPRDVEVVILRRSAVGEQAIDFRPTGSAEEFYEPGDVIEPNDVVTPVEVQRLLTLADEVFAPIDPENAGKLVSELADIVRGRRDDIRSLITDSAEFSADIADNGEDYDRLFAEGRKVTKTLADNREILVQSLDDMADAAGVLSDVRTDLEGLLAEAPPLLNQVTSLTSRADANLSCVITDLANINEFVAEPGQQDSIEGALRHNRWFFVGFDITAPMSPQGEVWNRIQFIPPQQPPPTSYLPERRPIPDILPGGACESPFGPGAGSAVQADYRKTVPEARIRRPGDDRVRPVRSAGGPIATGFDPPGDGGSGSGSTNGGDRGPVAAVPSGALPATGGGGVSFLLGLVLIGAAVPVARARLRVGDRGGEQR